MHFTKKKKQQEEPINFYEELFAKKSLEENIHLEKNETTKENKIEEPLKEIPKEKDLNSQDIKHIINEKKTFNMFDNLSYVNFRDKIKASGIKTKYIVTSLLLGIIVNISMTHYQEMNLQHTSQKFATGLMYNLSETNDLEQIAKNIYLGMKENGWEPKVKLSNGSIFVFELENGGEFTITKSQDISTTKFHVEITNFSKTMVKALMIQLEPAKIGGTKNFITSKKYDATQDKISFDLEKIGQGTLPTLEMPVTIPSLPPLSKNELSLPLPSPIISVPVSPELQGIIENDNKNLNNNLIKNEENIKNLLNKNIVEVKK